MYPFDLKRALAGEEVVTRQGKVVKEIPVETPKNLKPFDLQAVLQGKPVCNQAGLAMSVLYVTLDGALGEFLIQAKKAGTVKTVSRYNLKGEAKDNRDCLFMAPIKKTVYANITVTQLQNAATKEAGSCNMKVYDTKELAEAAATLLPRDTGGSFPRAPYIVIAHPIEVEI